MCAHTHSLEALDLEMVCSQSLFLGQLFVVGSYVLFEINVVSWLGRNGNIYEAQCLLCRETKIYSHHVLKKNQIYINGMEEYKVGKEESFFINLGHETHRTQVNTGRWPYSSMGPLQAPAHSAAVSIFRGTQKEREGRTEGPLDPAERSHAVREAHQNADFATKSNAGNTLVLRSRKWLLHQLNPHWLLPSFF